MSHNIVIIGAVAAGPKTACRLKRLRPEYHVTMVDRDRTISYGGCGIPYFISGDVSDASQLVSTSFHMVRDEKFFREAKDIEVLSRTEALSIDRAAQKVLVRSLDTGQERELPYDRLVLATGSKPKKLPIPGVDLDGVYTVSNINEAVRIKEMVSKGKVGTALIIGGGAIGLEMAEALADLWGIETTVVEIMDQILPGVVDPTIAHMAQKVMEDNEISFLLSEGVQSIEGDGAVERVITDKRTLDADLVIMAVGVQPNADLAKACGLELSSGGGIKVNKRFQTSDPTIYAGGDCVELPHIITGGTVYMPAGSLANREGRVIGTNLAGGEAEFPGVVGSFIIKIFDMAVAKAGLSLKQAQKAGFDAIHAFVVQADRAHFYPEMELLYMDLVVEKGTGRVLGVQGIGHKHAGLDGRVNAVGALLKYNATVEDVSNLEVAYAPPFSAAMDIVNALGNTAENILTERNRSIGISEFDKMFKDRSAGDFIFLDVRGPGNADPYAQKYPAVWINIPQDELRRRMSEVPKDKKLVLVCNSGVRSYEAQLALETAGFCDTVNLAGGIAALKKWGLDVLTLDEQD